MAILSVDLAYKNYPDIGAVILEDQPKVISCTLLSTPLEGVPVPRDLAASLDGICAQKNIRILLLDGPQGWKAADNGLFHSRRCERELNTPAKTGEPMSVKPANYGPFVTFSIEVYDALTALGWTRLPTVGSSLDPTCRFLVESFPLSAWRALGIRPLPAKAKTRSSDIARRRDALCSLFPIEISGTPTHDQLQAVVAGLAGLALEQNDWLSCQIVGLPPMLADGFWREGFIVNRLAPC